MVAILIVECYPVGYYKYMSDNLVSGFSIVKCCNLSIISLLRLYSVTETPARWCIFSYDLAGAICCNALIFSTILLLIPARLSELGGVSR